MRASMYGSVSSQNRAHRADLTWIKVGRSEYMRGDGVTIIKRADLSYPWWEVRNSSGQVIQMRMLHNMEFSDVMPCAGISLTEAKMFAQYVTDDAPVYKAVTR